MWVLRRRLEGGSWRDLHCFYMIPEWREGVRARSFLKAPCSRLPWDSCQSLLCPTFSHPSPLPLFRVKRLSRDSEVWFSFEKSWTLSRQVQALESAISRGKETNGSGDEVKKKHSSRLASRSLLSNKSVEYFFHPLRPSLLPSPIPLFPFPPSTSHPMYQGWFSAGVYQNRKHWVENKASVSGPSQVLLPLPVPKEGRRECIIQL